MDRNFYFLTKIKFPYRAVVQSLYSTSKSFADSNLQRFTPGCIAPNPRRIRTCSTLHTIGTISKRCDVINNMVNINYDD